MSAHSSRSAGDVGEKQSERSKKRKEKSIASVGGVMAQGGVAYHQLFGPEAPPGLP